MAIKNRRYGTKSKNISEYAGKYNSAWPDKRGGWYKTNHIAYFTTDLLIKWRKFGLYVRIPSGNLFELCRWIT